MPRLQPGANASAATIAHRRRADEAARVGDLLRVELISGCRGVEGLLPGEPELVRQFAVGRNVIRDALGQLRAEGLVERIRGSGTFALAAKAQHRFDRVHAIHDSVAEPGRVTGSVLSISQITAPRPVSQQLHIAPYAQCIFLEYTALIAGMPFSVGGSYLRLDVGAQIDRDVYDGDLYQLLEAAQFPVAGGDLTVEAILADERSAAILHIAPGSPLVLFQRKLVSPDGSPLEVGFVRCRGDRLSLQIQLPRTVKDKSE